MRLAIVGTRTFDDYNRLVSTLLQDYNPDYIDCVVTGDAHGTDELAVLFAKEFRIPLVVYKALWDEHGTRAGPIRNKEIVSDCTCVVAFWDGRSKGTLNTITQAVQAGKPVQIYPV